MWAEISGACFLSEQSHDSPPWPQPPHSVLPFSTPAPGSKIPVCSLAVPGLVALIACPWEGTAWPSHQLRSLLPTYLLCVLPLNNAPIGHWCRLGQAWTVCKQQGGEVASRALTQAQVVQAKQEEQGRPLLLHTFQGSGHLVGGGGGHDAPHTRPLFSRLVFGMLYPAYASYKAVKTKNIREYVSVAVGRRAWFRLDGMTVNLGGYGRPWQGGDGLTWPPLPPGA